MKKINGLTLGIIVAITTLLSFSHAATRNGSCLPCVANTTNNNLQESAVLIVETPIVESIKPRKQFKRSHKRSHKRLAKTPTPLVDAYCKEPHLPEFIW